MHAQEAGADGAEAAAREMTDQWFGCVRLYSEKYAKLKDAADVLAIAVLSDCSMIQGMMEKAIDYKFKLAGLSPYGTAGPQIAQLKNDIYEKGRTEAIGYIVRSRAKMAK